jgi:type II restriction/modification system DNA methylase subunit YeeA
VSNIINYFENGKKINYLKKILALYREKHFGNKTHLFCNISENVNLLAFFAEICRYLTFFEKNFGAPAFWGSG